ncbi:SIS domain-containing protein [Micromonospora sp. KC213]|nr:SIS domain-containing protein [Micromonospora sp. KC213]
MDHQHSSRPTRRTRAEPTRAEPTGVATVAGFVQEQPAAVRRAGAVLGPAVAQARVRLGDPSLLRRVLLVGSGTSHHASRIAAEAFAAAGRQVRAMVPSDAAYAPDLDPGPDLLVVGVSQSGGSTGTLGVLDRARAAGARTVLVTGEPTAVPPPFDAVLDVGCGPEPVGAKTKGFTATVLALLALGRGLDGVDDQVIRAVGGELPELLSDLLVRGSVAAERLTTAGTPGAVHVVTWGVWRPVADEGALKILETSLLPVEVWDVEEFLHGPHRRLSPGSLLVVVGDQDPRGRRADALVRFVRSLGARVLDVRAGGRDVVEPAYAAVALPAAGGPRAEQVLPAVVPLQLLALALTRARGLRPEADPFPDFHRLLGSKTTGATVTRSVQPRGARRAAGT